jgi:hypothetical protein
MQLTPGTLVVFPALEHIVCKGTTGKLHVYVFDVLQGDELIATSGLIFTTEQTYGETRVKGGERVVRLAVRGEVCSCISSSIVRTLIGLADAQLSPCTLRNV